MVLCKEGWGSGCTVRGISHGLQWVQKNPGVIIKFSLRLKNYVGLSMVKLSCMVVGFMVEDGWDSSWD